MPKVRILTYSSDAYWFLFFSRKCCQHPVTHLKALWHESRYGFSYYLLSTFNIDCFIWRGKYLKATSTYQYFFMQVWLLLLLLLSFLCTFHFLILLVVCIITDLKEIETASVCVWSRLIFKPTWLDRMVGVMIVKDVTCSFLTDSKGLSFHALLRNHP